MGGEVLNIGRVKILKRKVVTFSDANIPNNKLGELTAGLNFVKAFQGQTKFSNDFVSIDLSHYKLGSSCFVQDGGSFVRYALCQVLDMMIMRDYYTLLKKAENRNPLAQRRLTIALNNLEKQLNDVLNINAICANVVLARLTITNDCVEYAGNTPVSYLSDELFSSPLNQDSTAIVDYVYSGQAAGEVNNIVKREIDMTLGKYAPPNFFGISAFTNDYVRVDDALLSFLMSRRHHLAPISSQLFALNALAEVEKVDKYFNAGMVLQVALDRLITEPMEDTITKSSSAFTMSDMLKEIYDLDVNFDFAANEKYTIVDHTTNMTFVVSFLSLRDIALLGGHPSTNVSYVNNGLKIALAHGYVIVDFPTISNIKSYLVAVRRLVILSTALFSMSSEVRDGRITLNLRHVFLKELGVA